jgi:hypothetical protein
VGEGRSPSQRSATPYYSFATPTIFHITCSATVSPSSVTRIELAGARPRPSATRSSRQPVPHLPTPVYLADRVLPLCPVTPPTDFPYRTSIFPDVTEYILPFPALRRRIPEQRRRSGTSDSPVPPRTLRIIVGPSTLHPLSPLNHVPSRSITILGRTYRHKNNNKVRVTKPNSAFTNIGAHREGCYQAIRNFPLDSYRTHQSPSADGRYQ